MIVWFNFFLSMSKIMRPFFLSMSMIVMSVLPFFASMSSQASVFLGKGMAAQTELLRSPIFKWFRYKLNNEVKMLIIFDPTFSRAALESQSDFL